MTTFKDKCLALYYDSDAKDGELPRIQKPPTLASWLRLMPVKKYYVVNGGGLLIFWEKQSSWDKGVQKERIIDFDSVTGEPTDWEALYKLIKN